MLVNTTAIIQNYVYILQFKAEKINYAIKFSLQKMQKILFIFNLNITGILSGFLKI